MSGSGLVRQVQSFALVGVIATLVHLGTALLARSVFSASPLAANFAGYSLAFMVSFFGNARLTFRETVAAGRLLRFLVVSLTGLALSQSVVYVLAERLGLPFRAALAVVVVVAPTFTFIMSRLWVFRPARLQD